MTLYSQNTDEFGINVSSTDLNDFYSFGLTARSNLNSLDTNNFSINSAWVSDNNGIKDLAGVDFLYASSLNVAGAYVNSSGERRVIVRNPWGVDGTTVIGANDGSLDLSFSQFQESLNYGITVI